MMLLLLSASVLFSVKTSTRWGSLPLRWPGDSHEHNKILSTGPRLGKKSVRFCPSTIVLTRR